MRLPFVMTCVAGAVCLVSVNSSAELPNTPTKSALSPAPPRSESSVKRHSSAQKLGNNEEERMNPAEAEKALEMFKYHYTDKSLEDLLKRGVKPDIFIKQLGLREALEKPANNLLIAFNLEHLYNFMQRYNEDNNLNPITLKETLSQFHGGSSQNEDINDNLLEARGKVIADDLRRLQRKMSPLEAFTDMGLQATRDYTLAKPGLMTRWVDYAEAYKKVYPEMATSTSGVLSTIGYSDEHIVTLVSTEKNVPRKDSRKGIVLDDLMDSWLRKKFGPDEVAEKLKLLDEAKNRAEFLEKPQVKIWMKYVDQINGEGKQVSYSSLCTVTNIPRDDMVEMLLESKWTPTNKQLALDFVKQLKEKRKEILRRGHDKAGLDKVDYQLDALYVYATGRGKKIET